jgi:hypothetical protein
MNNIQRRLFRAFTEAGGDLSEDGEVERFIRYVEAHLVLLPPKVREATELVWRNRDGALYAGLVAQLSARDGAPVNPASVRQRVSRGVRLLEDAVRQRCWGSVPPSAGGGTLWATEAQRAMRPQVPGQAARR